MAKKIEEAEVKKECPSCGLGVPLDSKICEFCGWDFEEEDEWILQIEKLERELMLEKQKFEPGSVEQKIQATLYTPEEAGGGKEKQPPEERAAPREQPAPKKQARRVARAAAPSPEPAPATRAGAPERPAAVTETIEIEDAKIRTVRGAPEPTAESTPVPVRRVRTAGPPPAKAAGQAAPKASSGEGGRTKKVRVVRRVKK